MTAIKQLLLATVVGLSMNVFNIGEAFALTVTKIADSKDTSFRNFGLYPAINNEGTVVFSANQDADGRTTGIFIGSGGSTKTIADTNGSFSLFANVPAINDKGVVAFRANLDKIGSGVFTVNSTGEITTIAESSQPRGVFEDPVINNKGTVAFAGAVEGGRGIFTSSDGVKKIIADTNGSFSSFDGYVIDDADTVAFSARLKSGNGIFTNDGNTNTTIVDTSDRFSFLFPNAINNTGTVAFKGGLKAGGEGLFTVKNRNTTTVADNTGMFQFFDNAAINDVDTVAFKGFLDNGSLGIYTGANPVTDKVIATGDSLFGSKVIDLFFSNQGLNDKNQIVFYAKLADNTTGIFRADLNSAPPVSVPETTSVLGMMTLGALGTVGTLRRGGMGGDRQA